MQRSVVVTLPEGLHARPAAQFVAAAGRLPAKVTIAKPGGTPVATASILAIMTLGVGTGDEVVLETADDDADATASIDALEEFLRQTA
ncbi:HPr family phosphocarrier protein [uncultured Cellulomonas sp.]|uniref:HPr family phosphocarrier protein n=1 Tax=uncultured Cellulomonas sp. TaxID=189682 RepID=UPI0028E8690E|nr:HPr family phosphocarrier protein [uncultured Cellulomonas sp.]